MVVSNDNSSVIWISETDSELGKVHGTTMQTVTKGMATFDDIRFEGTPGSSNVPFKI